MSARIRTPYSRLDNKLDAYEAPPRRLPFVPQDFGSMVFHKAWFN